jgi:hypothetical protein
MMLATISQSNTDPDRPQDLDQEIEPSLTHKAILRTAKIRRRHFGQRNRTWYLQYTSLSDDTHNKANYYIHPDFTIKQMKESLDRYDRQHLSERKGARIEGVASAATEDRDCETCSILHKEESTHTTHSANIACPVYNQDRVRSLAKDWKAKQNQPPPKDRSQENSYRFALMRNPPPYTGG